MPTMQPPVSFTGRWRSLARRSSGALLILAALGAVWLTVGRAAEPATVIPAPALGASKEVSKDDSKPGAPGLQTVVLAGGCFWGVQAVFQHVKGVSQALSGYAGGTKETASYEIVSSGQTGHAEAVQVTFDPRQI